MRHDKQQPPSGSLPVTPTLSAPSRGPPWPFFHAPGHPSQAVSGALCPAHRNLPQGAAQCSEMPRVRRCPSRPRRPRPPEPSAASPRPPRPTHLARPGHGLPGSGGRAGRRPVRWMHAEPGEWRPDVPPARHSTAALRRHPTPPSHHTGVPKLNLSADRRPADGRYGHIPHSPPTKHTHMNSRQWSQHFIHTIPVYMCVWVPTRTPGQLSPGSRGQASRARSPPAPHRATRGCAGHVQPKGNPTGQGSGCHIAPRGWNSTRDSVSWRGQHRTPALGCLHGAHRSVGTLPPPDKLLLGELRSRAEGGLTLYPLLYCLSLTIWTDSQIF